MKSNCLMWKRAVGSMALVVIMAGCGAARSAPRTAAAAAAPDDQTLKTRVQTSLMNATGVHPNEVTTEVAQGVVTLSGTVHGQAEADAALAAARRVEGSKDVRSNLKVQ
ncbi:MAG TPA: BON domain-containing protein [Vicinamibacterales bacterium]|nr:BON domain-containing protein [Vicinamibacterales bacterium]